MGRRPLVEALDVYALMAPAFPADESKQPNQLAIRADLYIAAPDAQASLAFPVHRMTGRVRGDERDLPFVSFRFDSADPAWSTVQAGEKQFIVQGAGAVSLFAYPRYEDSYQGVWRSVRHFTVDLKLRLPFDDRPFPITRS
ncbi:MAG: hypothetical protein IPG04_10490 [Polyangiaceae bacterium]|nr:hypothetical protein [Polyangiaceae bacterium]